MLQSERAFTADEEEKLQGALQLDPKDLDLVINTTTFILQQAAYHLAKPAVLKTQLAAIGLEEEKVREETGTGVCGDWQTLHGYL